MEVITLYGLLFIMEYVADEAMLAHQGCASIVIEKANRCWTVAHPPAWQNLCFTRATMRLGSTPQLRTSLIRI